MKITAISFKDSVQVGSASLTYLRVSAITCEVSVQGEFVKLVVPGHPVRLIPMSNVGWMDIEESPTADKTAKPAGK